MSEQLWDLVWGKPEVDPNSLAEAIEKELKSGEPDHRTCLLIRDAADALEKYWGKPRMNEWLQQSPARERIEQIRKDSLSETGFPHLSGALVESTRPETVMQFLRELGTTTQKPAELFIGGSIALILSGHLSRATTDIDVVDEVPASIRRDVNLLGDMNKRYGLQLTHFQSHFLPSDWQTRCHSLGKFGKLQVFLVDVYDVFIGKLFSPRAKDLDDLRVLLPKLDRTRINRQLRETSSKLIADAALRENASKNWYVLCGEVLDI